jgi:hypothetical protein
MKPSFRAFTEELFLIKSSEEAAPAGQRLDRLKLFKQMLLNSLQYGAGFGLGSGVGWLTAEKLLPKTFANLSGGARTAIGAGAGVLAGLGTMAAGEAMRHARQKENEVATIRDHQRL